MDEFPRSGNLLRDLIIRLDKFGLEFLSKDAIDILIRLEMLETSIQDQYLKNVIKKFREAIIKYENIKEGRTRYDILKLFMEENEVPTNESKIKKFFRRG